MDATTNPLLLAGDDTLGLPDFARIRAEHFAPAFERAMALHRADIAAITAQDAPPDFDNTVAAFDRAGALLARVEAVFHNLAASASRVSRGVMPSTFSRRPEPGSGSINPHVSPPPAARWMPKQLRHAVRSGEAPYAATAPAALFGRSPSRWQIA